MPLDVYASHSYEAGVQGDNIPDNTHVDLSQLILPSGGVFPLYDSSPNFVSGHFLYKAPCDQDKQPIVEVIAGHIDESANLTHVDFVPLYYVGHASSPGICVYHAHLPDPLEGGSPRITDVDLINRSPEPVVFNPGDAVDINIQRSLGNIGEYYANDVLLPANLTGTNKVIDLNEEHDDVQQQDANVQQQIVGNLENLKANDVINLPFELANGNNNQVFNLDEEHDNDNDNDVGEQDHDEGEEDDEDEK
jgi:hypothetical protein